MAGAHALAEPRYGRRVAEKFLEAHVLSLAVLSALRLLECTFYPSNLVPSALRVATSSQFRGTGGYSSRCAVYFQNVARIMPQNPVFNPVETLVTPATLMVTQGTCAIRAFAILC